MKKNGFTLIEMLIVMFIISMLLIIIVPNMTKHNETVQAKGCDAYVKTVQAQVESYQLEKGAIPTLEQLQQEGYIKETKCPNGRVLKLSTAGEVIVDK